MIENFLLDTTKKRKKISFTTVTKKSIIWIIILFFVITSLWGCSQQIFNNSLVQYSSPGGGFEIISNNTQALNHHIMNNNSEVSFRYINSFQSAIKLGPFFGLFVFPLESLVIIIFHWLNTPLLKNNNQFYGHSFSTIFTIFIIVILIRSILTFFSFRQFKQQIIMQQIQPKIAEIKLRYHGMNDLASKQRMQKEIFAVNREIGVNPIESFGINFITLPFFYAMYRVFSSLRIYKNEWIINSKNKFIYSTWTAISHYHLWIYLLFAFILVPIQIGTIKIPTFLAKKTIKKQPSNEATKKSMKTNKLIFNIMTLFTAVISFIVPLSVVFYLMFSGVYTILQTLIINYINQKKSLKKTSKIKLKSITKQNLKMLRNKKNIIHKLTSAQNLFTLYLYKY